MKADQRPGALRLAALEGAVRNGSPVREISEHLDSVLEQFSDDGNGSLSLPGMVSQKGLELPLGLSFDAWSQVGFTLRRIHKSWRWWIGDWVQYGEQKFGEMASQITDELDLDYQQVADCAYVAGRIPISRRRENLSWSHHREVAKLPEPQADAMLAQAEEARWTRARLRIEVNLVSSPQPVVEMTCYCHCHSGQCPDCGKPS